MTTNGVRAALVVGLALAVAACVASARNDDSRGYGDNGIPDPTSTGEIGGGGGASYLSLTIEEIAAASTALVEVKIVDILPSRFNTSDGKFPSLEDLESFGITPLEVYTEARIDVLEVLSGKGVTEGTAVLVIGGGRYETLLDPDRANAVGMREGADDRLVTQPQEIVFGTSTGLDLLQGDVVTLLLTEITVHGYAGSRDGTALTVTHPDGVLSPSTDGKWLVGTRQLARDPMRVDRSGLLDKVGTDSLTP